MTLAGSWVYCVHVRFLACTYSFVRSPYCSLGTNGLGATLRRPRCHIPRLASLSASPAIVPRLVTSFILYIICLLLSPNFPHIYPVNFHNIGAANIQFFVLFFFNWIIMYSPSAPMFNRQVQQVWAVPPGQSWVSAGEIPIFPLPLAESGEKLVSPREK